MSKQLMSNDLDTVLPELPDYADAPPDYDTLIDIPDRNDIPQPATYDPPTLEGIPENEFKSPAPPYSPPVNQPALPRLAYADFLPSLPHCSDFKTLMWIVNDWLVKNPHFRVLRVECIKRKVDKSGILETESTIYHCSAFGYTNYVIGVRLWLAPNTDNEPTQQLWYVNVVPKGEMKVVPHMGLGVGVAMGMGYNPRTGMAFPGMCVRGRPMCYLDFESVDDVLAKVNQSIRQKPLPGSVLSVETVQLKHESVWRPGCLEPDKCYWQEKGASTALFVDILKIFFVVGGPPPREIGIMDFAPACLTQGRTAIGKPRFEDFANVMEKTSCWINGHKDVNIINMQTIDTKVCTSLCTENGFRVDTRSMDYSKGYECVLVRTLRIPYIKGQANRISRLCSKVFVPVRTAVRQAETTSTTVARANQWLNCIGSKVLSADTLKFEVSAERMREVNTSVSSYAIHNTIGSYWMTVIRVYLDGDFTEPPLEVYYPPPPIIKPQQDDSECCVIV